MFIALKRFAAAALALAVVATCAPARAASVDALIEKLVEKKILTRIEAETLRADVESAERNKFIQNVQQSNPWLEGIQQKGDLRLRYEGFGLENEDGRDRDRFRFRLRWGLEKKFNDEFLAGFRLASGPTNEATSSNQSFDDEFLPKTVNIDRAYAIWTPNKYVKEYMPNLTTEVGAGKVANPYEKWQTTIIMDNDVNPEGIYERFDWKLMDVGDPSLGGKWELNTLFGQFVLNENSTGEDAELYVHGLGTTFNWDKSTYLTARYSYYDWQDYERLATFGSVISGSPNGNDRNLDDFHVHSIYVEGGKPVSTWWGTQPLKVFGHYIMNSEEGSQLEPGTGGETRSFNQDEDQGASAGVQLGSAKKQGEWEAKYQWYYLEANATPGNFAESDLGLGFANNKGHQLSYAYRIYDSIVIQGTYWMVERVDAAVSSAINATPVFEDREVSRWQLDIIYSF